MYRILIRLNTRYQKNPMTMASRSPSLGVHKLATHPPTITASIPLPDALRSMSLKARPRLWVATTL